MKNSGRFYGLISGMIIFLALGCTKERPLKTVLKENTLAKAIIDENADYIYAPSVIASPRSTTATRPFWQGQGKRVRFKFSENELRVYEVESDRRFTDNITNQKPVMAIPIDHRDYKCVEDSYGQCTHQEKENDEISWQEKKMFHPNFEQMNLQEVNVLPIEIENLFASCYTPISSEFVGYKIEPDAINFEIEKVFRTQLECVSSLESLSDLTFSVRYHYSFVRLDSLATPEYKPISYTRAEETMFGFFTTRNLELDVDNNDVISSERVYLNRWYPNQTVTYYLNDAFNKPENSKIKQATYQSVATINAGLKQAGTPLRLDLKEPDKAVRAGDLRYNMIVMVEDPQATGIIGYGPSLANPLTGEILNARVVMYAGTMKKYVKYSYEDIVAEKLSQESAKNQMAQKGLDRSLAFHLAMPEVAQFSALALPAIDVTLPGGSANRHHDFRQIIKIGRSQVLNPQSLTTLSTDVRNRIELLSRNNAYPAELFNFHAALEEGIDELLAKTEMKPWDLLDSQERELVVQTLLPYVWVPTLVHELGHNLGLRHNFAGSEDKANFYSDEELQQMGAQAKYKYSSVMDYAYRTTNELRVMGKYDIAALRFGYSEKVELADGHQIPRQDLAKTDPSLLKAYDFCTDEHVSVNPNCNRFDEGTNLVEIAEHQIRAYKERYKRANFRHTRRNFSLYQDISQIAYLHGLFGNFRLMFERYENIKNTFHLPDNAPEWEQIAFLKELKTATLMGGRFMLEVLKTPDTLCAISSQQAPTQILAVIPISELSPFAATCFDQENIQLVSPYIVVGEGGQSFASKKDPRSSNPYLDQIDVRGIWMDKLIAAHYLLSRQPNFGLTDRFTENYLHIPELQNEVLSTFASIITDELSAAVTFESIFGVPFELEFQYRLADHSQIDRQVIALTRSVMGLPDGPTTLNRMLIAELKANLPSPLHASLGKSFYDLFSAELEPQIGRSISDYSRLDVGSESFFALPENVLAKDLIETVGIIQKLSQLDAEKLTAAVKKFTENGDTTTTSEEEKAVQELGIAIVTRFLNQGYKPATYYIDTLRLLAQPDNSR